MPDDNTQKSGKGVKSVQTLLAAKKTGSNETTKEKPSKQNKRSHSDVAEESLEGMDSMAIQGDLKDIKKSLQGTVTKSDLNTAMDQLVKEKDLKVLVNQIVNGILDKFKDSITKEISEKFDQKLREKTGKLDDKIDSLCIENELLKERLRSKEKSIQVLEEKLVDCNRRSTDALKLGNFNEQYSRKHNIRMLNFEEKREENLRNDFINLVKSDLKVEIKPDDVLAIHRIPGKSGIRPVIVKVRNTETKVKIMREKKKLGKNIKFHDDITQKNLGLMTRLKESKLFENVWFYNSSVYAKQTEGNRMKFDIFDNIEERLRKGK